MKNFGSLFYYCSILNEPGSYWSEKEKLRL